MVHETKMNNTTVPINHWQEQGRREEEEKEEEEKEGR